MESHFSRVQRVALVAAIFYSTLFCQRTLAQDYTITDLGRGAAHAINAHGDVVGRTADESFLWRDGMLFAFDPLQGGYSEAYDINDHGWVVGYGYNLRGMGHAWLWRDDNENGQVDAGEVADLGTLGGSYSFASGINNHGRVVGYSQTSTFLQRPFLWTNGTMVDLGALRSGGSGFAAGINDAGQIVGESDSPTQNDEAFVWQAGSMAGLGTLPGYSSSVAFAINDAGQVVGYASRSFPFQRRAFLWDGQMHDLGVLPGATDSEALGINAAGAVVGTSGRRAFVWANGVMTDLNDLLPPDSGWSLEEAIGINEAGQIVGAGRVAHDQDPFPWQHGFVLSPRPQPVRLGVNCSNDGSMRPGVPDVDFIIDEHDEAVSETLGFNFWWSRESDQSLTLTGLVDLAPLVVIVPEAVGNSNQRFYFQLEGDAALTALFVYPAVSESENRRAFLQDKSAGEAQLAQAGAGIKLENRGPPVTVTVSGTGTNEFVFKAVGDGVATATLRVLVAEAGADGDPVVQDSIRLNLKDPIHYWLFASARGTDIAPVQPTIPFEYPTENGRHVTIPRYPTVNETGWATAGALDPEKRQQVVFVHGYANSLEQAFDANTEYYKRLFWLGYRGNYIGFAWEGNEGRIGPLTIPWPGGPLTIGPLTLYDPNVKNAFQAAPALMYFLRDLRSRAGAAANVNLVAHSLGNFTSWEALRLHARLYPGEKLLRNICSVETAIWIELWDPADELHYAAPDDPVSYSVDQLQRHSWRFWLNQPGCDPRQALAGRAYHSYVEDDFALVDAMRGNDWLFRGFSFSRFLHYNRDRLLCDKIQPCYRAPVEDFHWPWHLAELPTLLTPGGRDQQAYFYTKLNVPAGATPNPQVADEDNYAASRGGWPQGEHSAFRDLSLPQIYLWWHQFLGNGIDEKRISRIPLGEE